MNMKGHGGHSVEPGRVREKRLECRGSRPTVRSILEIPHRDEPFTARTALVKGLFEGIEGQVRGQ